MQMETMYESLGVRPDVFAFGEEVLEGLRERFDAIDRVAEYNQAKVVGAMQKNRVSAQCFAATTGYGYDDVGRDCLERVYADAFHATTTASAPPSTSGRSWSPSSAPRAIRRGRPSPSSRSAN